MFEIGPLDDSGKVVHVRCKVCIPEESGGWIKLGSSKKHLTTAAHLKRVRAADAAEQSRHDADARRMEPYIGTIWGNPLPPAEQPIPRPSMFSSLPADEHDMDIQFDLPHELDQYIPMNIEEPFNADDEARNLEAALDLLLMSSREEDELGVGRGAFDDDNDEGSNFRDQFRAMGELFLLPLHWLYTDIQWQA